jgi:hypothetical protein
MLSVDIQFDYFKEKHYYMVYIKRNHERSMQVFYTDFNNGAPSEFQGIATTVSVEGV